MEEQYWQLGEVGKSVLMEVLSECGGSHDIIYNGINTIEYVKFLLKIKYSFIFNPDHTNMDDNEEESNSTEIVSNIAQWLSKRDVIAAYKFKEIIAGQSFPDDPNLNNFRKITSLVNEHTNISFIKDYLSVYSNLLEEVLKEVLFNYIIIGEASADPPEGRLQYVITRVKHIGEGLNTAGVIQTFKQRLEGILIQMSTDFVFKRRIQDISALLLQAFTIEEQKAQTANSVAAAAAAAQYSGPVEENFQHIDFILNLCDKFNDYAYLWQEDNGLFIQYSRLYLEKRRIMLMYHSILLNDDFDFFFEELIRISTNDFTDQPEIAKLETVITQHVTNHTNQIYNINEILNKNLLDMSIKTNSGLFDVEIFETYEFQSALAAGGYDEWNSVSLQQIQYMEEWNQQIQSMQPDYWYQLHQSERERERERRIQAVHTMQQMQQISPQQAEQLLQQMHQRPPEEGALLLKEIQDSLRQPWPLGPGS